MIDFLIEIDKETFLFLNSINNGFLDFLMYYISHKLTWIPLYLFLIYLIQSRFGWSGLLIVLVVVAILATLSDRSSVFLKDYFMRNRPCVGLTSEGYHVHIVRDICIQHWGFVSSHAANTFALATFIILLLQKHYRFIAPVMLTYSSLASYSRIYLGLHYPGDIIFGAALGVLLGWFVFFLLKKLLPCSVCFTD